MLRDLRYALRQLLRTPAFSLVAILTLALGTGATTAIFSVVNGVLLRPLPYPQPDRLVRVHETVPQYGRFSVAPATFLDWRQQATRFERIAAYANGSATITQGEGPERITGAVVSWDLFDLLRVAPAQGTGFRAEQDRPGSNDVIIISHGLWQRRFGGAPDVVGKSIAYSGATVTIIGIMPPDFAFPTRAAEYWRPIALNTANPSRGGHNLGVIARLKDGVTIEQAGAEIKAISERLATQYPDNSAGESAEVVSLHEQIVGTVRPALVTLLAAVAVVVLIACANVANLLLVRASGREKELAIRAAMGADRRRLVAQMLVESLVLGVAGSGLGLLLAYLAIPLVQTLGAGSIPRVADVGIDRTVLMFAVLASLATGIIFGLAPAWQASRVGLGTVLKEHSRSAVGPQGRWLRNGLLVAEVGLSIVLLVGAALLLRSFARLTSVDPGFRADRVLAFQVALPQPTYPQDSNRVAFFDAFLERLEATPEIENVGMVQTLPLRGSYVLTFDVRGRAPAEPGKEVSANHRGVSPGFFTALGIPLKQGRLLNAHDTETSPMVAVVDETFARRFFSNENPIGQGIDIGNGSDGYYEIVGVVGAVHNSGLSAEPEPTMYVPFKQGVFASMWVVARTSGDPQAASGVVRQTLKTLDPGLPAFLMTPLSTIVNDSVADRRFSMLLLGTFALIALFLAAVGLYGVVAYSVTQRTREIGLRMALGASPGSVLGLIVGGGMKLALAGVVVGLAVATLVTRLVTTMLFQVEPLDPTAYVATSVVLLLVAAVACYIPARRAMRVDPLVALQDE
jgi:putative ABC transport system permease protein